MSSKDKRRSGSTGGDDDGGSKAKKGSVRICGACQVGYIEPGDLHPRCLGFLGAEHAGLALTERASCMFCRLLPEDTLRSRADFFSENPEQYWLLSDVLDIEPPDRLLTEHHLQEPGSDDSASASHGSSSGSPLLPPLHLRGWSSALRATLYVVALNHQHRFTPWCSYYKSFRTSLRSPALVVIFLCRRMPRRHPRKPPLAAITPGERPGLFLPGRYSPRTLKISKFSSAILALCAPIAIASARISAWQTMIARNVWLHLSSIPEAVRKDMLEGPISPDGLFGPHFQHLVREMQTASEEAEKIRRHVTAPSRSAGHWRDRRELSHRQRRPASSAAAASRPAPVQPAPPPPPPAPQAAAPSRRSSKPRKLACSWSRPPVEPPRILTGWGGHV
ncbi:hypothetical protein Q8A73_014445 [Channa argus]|nr:hypothetical protein Q8A73_014445 [Channa argus]